MCESAEKEGGMYACVIDVLYVCVLYGVPYVKNIQLEYTAPKIKR